MDEDQAAPVDVDRSTPFGEGSYFATVRMQAATEDPQRKKRQLSLKVPVLVVLAFCVVAALVYIEIPKNGTAAIEPSGIAFCDDSGRRLRNPVELAITEMRQTSEGERLFDELVANEVCIGFEAIPYNAGYMRPELARSGSIEVEIILDRGIVVALYSDELAALLIHEATHADRVLSGKSCAQSRSCEMLPNGVPLDEEVAAHLAEAEFWIAIHGPTGTRSGVSYGGTAGAAYLNDLVARYQEGPAVFRSYVRKLRSSSNEGRGINP